MPNNFQTYSKQTKEINTNQYMNPAIINIVQIAFAIFCIVFGIDKFVEFLPTCSLTTVIPKEGMMITGVLEIGIGIMLLLKKHTLLILRIGTAIILGGLLMHIVKGTDDVGGALLGSIMGLFLIIAHKRTITLTSKGG